MQNANRQLDPLRDRVAELEQIQQNLEQQVNELQNECNDLNDRMAELKVLHAQELENLKQECNERIHNILTKHEDELRELEQKYNEHLEELQSRMKDREAALTQTIEQTKEQLHQREDELGQLQESYDSLSELQTVNQARIKALMFENGRQFSDDDFTDKQAFDELERELEAFATFFDQRWGKTKKKIRKQLLNYQSLKGQNGQKD